MLYIICNMPTLLMCKSLLINIQLQEIFTQSLLFVIIIYVFRIVLCAKKIGKTIYYILLVETVILRHDLLLFYVLLYYFIFIHYIYRVECTICIENA